MEKILSSEYVTVGELVRLTGCRYSTLKYYTEEEILPFEQEEEKFNPKIQAGGKHRENFSDPGA